MAKDKDFEEQEETDEEEFDEALEESELEEVVEKSETVKNNGSLNFENLQNFDFSSLASQPQVSRASAPVLESITAEQEGPRFIPMGSGRATQETATTFEEGGETTYLPTQEQGNDSPKYLAAEQISTSLKRVNPLKETFNLQPQIPSQETFFMQAHGNRGGSAWTPESIKATPERINPMQAGRENPVEAEERKYEKYDPDLPKSS